jgi:hypothetical protein
MKYRMKTRKNKRQRGGSKCEYFDIDIHSKYNKVHQMCIPHEIQPTKFFYITPHNFYTQNLESLSVPKFYIKLADGRTVLREIIIENKYVACFLHIREKWYIILRLLGTVFNMGVLAQTEENRAYFRFRSKCIQVDIKSGLIHFVKGVYSETVTPSFLFSPSNAININDNCLQNITSKDKDYIFEILQIFRMGRHHAYL